eukprot:11232345-Alexandrium_andersonii.AAC.1
MQEASTRLAYVSCCAHFTDEGGRGEGKGTLRAGGRSGLPSLGQSQSQSQSQSWSQSWLMQEASARLAGLS